MADRRQTNQIEMLIRLDEQVKSLTKKVDELVNGIAKDVELLKSEKASKEDLNDLKFVIQNQMSELKDAINGVGGRIDSQREDNEKNYVTKDEFEPIKKLAYGSTAAVLLTVLAGILHLIIK